MTEKLTKLSDVLKYMAKVETKLREVEEQNRVLRKAFKTEGVLQTSMALCYQIDDLEKENIKLEHEVQRLQGIVVENTKE